MHKLCIIGPVSIDTIYHGERKAETMPGGVPVYGGLAAARLTDSIQIITRWAAADTGVFAALTGNPNISLTVLDTAETTRFRLEYPSRAHTERTLTLETQADGFDVTDFAAVNAPLIYLAPLISGDLDAVSIAEIKGDRQIALDVQGFLRKPVGKRISLAAWTAGETDLGDIDYLKASHEEATVMTGLDDPHQAAKHLLERGAGEVIVTRDQFGAVIATDGANHSIQAFRPPCHADATGCGDTFFAAYLIQRMKGAGPKEAGDFAAAAAALKISELGPLNKSQDAILKFMRTADRIRL